MTTEEGKMFTLSARYFLSTIGILSSCLISDVLSDKRVVWSVNAGGEKHVDSHGFVLVLGSGYILMTYFIQLSDSFQSLQLVI